MSKVFNCMAEDLKIEYEIENIIFYINFKIQCSTRSVIEKKIKIRYRLNLFKMYNNDCTL